MCIRDSSNITHTCGNEYLFISLANALADNLYIVCGLVRLIRNAYTAGKMCIRDRINRISGLSRA